MVAWTKCGCRDRESGSLLEVQDRDRESGSLLEVQDFLIGWSDGVSKGEN